MESIGLMPSSTGKVGGKKTGQSVADYPIPDGLFIFECERLIEKGFGLTWIDRYTAKGKKLDQLPEQAELIDALNLTDEIAEQLTAPVSSLLDDSDSFVEPEPASNKTKARYTCPLCNMNLWGKSGLSVKCGDCDEDLEEY